MTPEAQQPPDDDTWKDIRQRYETNTEPLKNIAAVVGLAPITLAKKAKSWGWLMRCRKPDAELNAIFKVKKLSNHATIQRLKALLQHRVENLESEISSLGQDISELGNERQARAMNTLVRTIEKVIELERKTRIRKRKNAAVAFKRLSDAERGSLADKIERMQEEWNGETPVLEPDTGGSTGPQ